MKKTWRQVCASLFFLSFIFSLAAFIKAYAEGSQAVIDIPPSIDNPRNSEGAFLELKDGKLMFAYTRFYGGASDNAGADIVAIYSLDKGLTWSEKPVVLVKNNARENVMSVSLLRLQDEKCALFYLRKNGLDDCRLFMHTSDNEGITWSESVLTIPAPGYFVVNNDRVIQLKSGRLIVPANFHRMKGENPHEMKNFDSRGIAFFYLSDDNGKTWKESETWWSLPVASNSGLQETGVVELKDGRLFSWARTDQGCQYGMFSWDKGETWTPPSPTAFRSPNSPLSLKRLPSTGHLVAIWNDHSGRFPVPEVQPSTAGRTPLVCAISKDEGKTWENFKVIENDPARGYCYTAIYFIDDHALLAYSAGGASTKGLLNLLRIRRIDQGWFYR